MQTRLLYAAVTATGQTSIDIPINARIVKVVWSIGSNTSPAAGEQIRCELSTVSTDQNGVNDAVGIISICGASQSLVTSGANTNSQNLVDPVDVRMGAGQRLYLNYTESGAATWTVRCLVWFT